jgi:hypothetical protein
LRGLSNRLRLQPGGPERAVPGFYVPFDHDATFPWVSHALWFYSQMVRWRQTELTASDVAHVRATYRPDLYRVALQAVGVDIPADDVKIERGFFDERGFDGGDLEGYLTGGR